MTLALLACACITVISAFVSLGYSLAAVRAAPPDARAVALYASSRSLALALVSVAAFALASIAWSEAMAACMIVVQAIDAAIGARLKDTLKTWGPAVTALFNAAALAWLAH